MNNKYWLKAKCSICDGVGNTDSSGNSAYWHGRSLVHINPAVCRDVLARKAKEIALEAKKLSENANAAFA